MTNDINTITGQSQECDNIKYKTHSEIQVLCEQRGKAFFSTDDHVDTKNTIPSHVCLKGLICAVSTQI